MHLVKAYAETKWWEYKMSGIRTEAQREGADVEKKTMKRQERHLVVRRVLEEVVSPRSVSYSSLLFSLPRWRCTEIHLETTGTPNVRSNEECRPPLST